ncbi:hypothetical protein [Arthrobacter humicola]
MTVAEQSPSAAATVITTPAATPAVEAAGFNVEGGFELKDEQGYTYGLIFQLTAPNGFVENPTNALPGETDLSLTSMTTVSVSNATPKRAAPGQGLAFEAYGVYPLDSRVCTMKVGPSDSFYDGKGAQLSGADGVMKYCIVGIGSSMFNYEKTIPVGGRIALQSNMGSGNHVQTFKGVPEAEAPADIKALNQPIATIALMTNGGNANTSTDISSRYTTNPASCLGNISIGLGADGGSPTTVTVVPLSGAKTACG